MGLELQRIFREKLEALPMPEFVSSKFTPAATKKSARTTPIARASSLSTGIMLTSGVAQIQMVPSPGPEVPVLVPAMASFGGGKKERRASTRPVKAPSRDLPDASKRRPGAQMRFCQQVIKELFNKKHAAYAWPFMKPGGTVRARVSHCSGR